MSTAVRSRSRQGAPRRRRRFGLLGILLAAGVGLLLALPLLRGEIRKLTLPLEHADIIRQQAQKKHVDPALIAAVIYAESKFNARRSPAGAEGLMQILPATALFLAHRSGATTFTTADLATPQVNIAYGTYYLRFLLDQYGGRDTRPGRVQRRPGERRPLAADARAAGRPFTIAAIAFPETRAYVVKVQAAKAAYRADYPTS